MRNPKLPSVPFSILISFLNLVSHDMAINITDLKPIGK